MLGTMCNCAQQILAQFHFHIYSCFHIDFYSNFHIEFHYH